MPTTILQVVPVDDRWLVVADDEAIKRFFTKQAALAFAKTLARANRGSVELLRSERIVEDVFRFDTDSKA